MPFPNLEETPIQSPEQTRMLEIARKFKEHLPKTAKELLKGNTRLSPDELEILLSNFFF